MASPGADGTRQARTRLIAPKPSWGRGAARLMDLGGTLRAYRLQPVKPRSDAASIAGDWQRVGDALRSAMQSFDAAKVPLAKTKR